MLSWFEPSSNQDNILRTTSSPTSVNLTEGAFAHDVDEDDVVHADLPDQELALGGVVTGGHKVGGVLVDVVHTIQEHHGVAAFHHRLRAPLGSASTSNYKHTQRQRRCIYNNAIGVILIGW